MSKKLLVSLLFICLALSFTNILNAQSVLTVHFLNVGQADSILIQTPEGKNMLIDAGNNDDFPSIEAYLKNHGVKCLDVVVGTHPHEDHIGSLDKVISGFEIGQIYMPKVSTNTKTFEDVLTAIKAKGLKVTTATAGVVIDIDPSVHMKMLAPIGTSYENLNDYSAVIKLVYGKTTFLFAGDASEVSESQMIQSGEDLKADLLKVGHHGSRTSTSEAFLEQVNPSIAVISVGKDNKFGHPTQETLNRLAAYNVQVYRTDFDGTVVATSDGETIKVDKKASPIKPNAPPVVRVKRHTSSNDNVTVYITRTGEKYHVYGCRYLRRSCYSIKLKDAKARGYTPCSVCGPPQ